MFLEYSSPIETKHIHKIMADIRDQFQELDDYDVDLDFSDEVSSSYLCGALANLPKLDHVVFDNVVEPLHVWISSDDVHTRKIGSVFREWTDLCERLLLMRSVEQAFFRVAFIGGYDDLPISFRTANDDTIGFDIELEVGEVVVEEEVVTRRDCLNQVLRSLQPVTEDRSEFFVDTANEMLLKLKQDLDSTIVEVEVNRWKLPIPRSMALQAKESMMGYVQSVDSFCLIACRLEMSRDQWSQLALEKGLFMGRYEFRFEGTLSSEAKEFLRHGSDSFEGYLPALRYVVNNASPQFELNVGVLCMGDSSRIVLSAGDEDNSITEDEDDIAERIGSIPALKDVFAKKKAKRNWK